MTHLILYGTTDCHRCEEAQRVIYQALGVRLDVIEIADDPDLLARYSLRIPVLRHAAATGAELDWPFGASDARQFSDLLNCTPATLDIPGDWEYPLQDADGGRQDQLGMAFREGTRLSREQDFTGR